MLNVGRNGTNAAWEAPSPPAAPGKGTEHTQQLTPSTSSSTTGLAGDPLAAGQIAVGFFFFEGKILPEVKCS